MTAACRTPGTCATAICAGCNVEGFAAHHCTREAIAIAANGQASVEMCGCQVEPSCRSHRKVPR